MGVQQGQSAATQAGLVLQDQGAPRGRPQRPVQQAEDDQKQLPETGCKLGTQAGRRLLTPGREEAAAQQHRSVLHPSPWTGPPAASEGTALRGDSV